VPEDPVGRRSDSSGEDELGLPEASAPDEFELDSSDEPAAPAGRRSAGPVDVELESPDSDFVDGWADSPSSASVVPDSDELG
jgi:hypothetical protein